MKVISLTCLMIYILVSCSTDYDDLLIEKRLKILNEIETLDHLKVILLRKFGNNSNLPENYVISSHEYKTLNNENCIRFLKENNFDQINLHSFKDSNNRSRIYEISLYSFGGNFGGTIYLTLKKDDKKDYHSRTYTQLYVKNDWYIAIEK